MELKAWVKTLLSVYRYFEKVCEAIDKIVEKRADASKFVGSVNMATNNAFAVASKIMQLTQRKIALINCKLIVEKVLHEISKEEAKLLMLKYNDNLKAEDIMALTGLTRRTLFRKLQTGCENFAKCLRREGFNAEYFSKTLMQDEWIVSIYSQNLDFCKKNKNENASIGFGEKFINLICREYSADGSSKAFC